MVWSFEDKGAIGTTCGQQGKKREVVGISTIQLDMDTKERKFMANSKKHNVLEVREKGGDREGNNIKRKAEGVSSRRL